MVPVSQCTTLPGQHTVSHTGRASRAVPFRGDASPACSACSSHQADQAPGAGEPASALAACRAYVGGPRVRQGRVATLRVPFVWL